MAHQARTRANLAAWGSGAVSPSEFDSLDQKGFQSINGDAGGAWAPTNAIEIGGSGLVMIGPFVSTGGAEFETAGFQTASINDLTCGNLTINGNTQIGNNVGTDTVTVIADMTIQGDLIVDSPAQFNSNVTLGNALTDTASVMGELSVYGDAVFRGDMQIGVGGGEELLVDADMTITGDATINGVFNFSGASVEIGNSTVMHFGTSARITGSPTLGNRLRFDESGRVPWRAAQLSNASQDFSVVDGNFFTAIPQGTDKTYALLDDGAVSGDFIFISNGSSLLGAGTDAIIEYGSGPSQVILPPRTTTEPCKPSLFVFMFTGWQFFQFS